MKKPFSYLTAFAAASLMCLNTGCVSGGFSITRSYARFVNSQKYIILRAIVFLLTIPVYMVTILIDLLIFNTIDFWEGKVAAGDYEFVRDRKIFYAHHEIKPDQLKRSDIRIQDQDTGAILQTLTINEFQKDKIELLVDGRKVAEVSDIHDLHQLENSSSGIF